MKADTTAFPSAVFERGRLADTGAVPLLADVARVLDPDLWLHFVTFFERLRGLLERARPTPLVALVNRRASCLYRMLLALGMQPLPGIVTSDRILDLEPQLLVGRPVWFVDDSVKTGINLIRLAQRVDERTEAGAGVCEFLAPFYDSDQLLPDVSTMLNRPDPDLGRALASADRQRVSDGLALQLGLAGIPYFVDFPWFAPLDLTKHDVAEILRMPDWQAFNVSNMVHFSNSVELFSLIPCEQARVRLDRDLGEHLVNLLDLMKIRANVRWDVTGARVRLMPKVTLKAIKLADARELCRALIEAAGGSPPDSFDSWRPESHHRVAQFLLSNALARRFTLDVSDLTDARPLRLEISQADADFHFGPNLGPKFAEWSATLLGRPIEEITAAERMIPATDWTFIDDMITPTNTARFATIRSLLTTIPAQVKHLRRDIGWAPLNLAIAFNELSLIRDEAAAVVRSKMERALRNVPVEKRMATMRALVADVPTWAVTIDDLIPADVERCVRKAGVLLDYCNDAGIAVPRTAATDRYVGRCYHAGENAYLGGQPHAYREQFAADLVANGEPAPSEDEMRELVASLAEMGVIDQRLVEGYDAGHPDRISRRVP